MPAMRLPRPFRWGKFATLGALLGAVAVMVTLVSYSVPLYRLFCQATGSLGTTQRVAAVSGPISDRMVTVRFLTSTAPGLPWRFAPVQDTVRVRLGQDALVFFEAENLSDEPIVGHATFNVTPEKIGKYFKKIQCFCFTEERLEPHQKVEMPVDFFVNSRMGDDRSTTDVTEIDLSYEFFRSRKPAGATELARFEQAPPDPVAGQKVFATACTSCHGLDRSQVGPPLRGVFGRRAGTAPGYPIFPGARPCRADLGYRHADQVAVRPAILHCRRTDADGTARPAAPARRDRLPEVAVASWAHPGGSVGLPAASAPSIRNLMLAAGLRTVCPVRAFPHGGVRLTARLSLALLLRLSRP